MAFAPAVLKRPFALALVFALPAAVVAVLQLGRLHPDEVFQSLEPANWRAFGYGVLAWEWQQGLRNWVVPGLFSWLLKACAAVGLDHPLARRAVLEVPQWLLHAAMLLSVYRFAERRVGALAVWAFPLVGLSGLVLHFAGRTMGEAWSAAFLVWGLERLDARGVRPSAEGGLVLGLAVVARYGSAVMVAAAVLLVLAQRRWKDALAALGGGLVAAALLGAVDWATWGKPFHSFLAYLDYNVLSGQAAQAFGAEPGWYYLPLFGWLVLWAWPGLVFGVRPRAFESKPVWWLAFPAVAYAVAISLTAHKEARFLYPALVLLAVAAVPGWLSVLSRVQAPERRQLFLTASVLVALSVVAFESPFAPQRPQQFRLWVRASREATGVVLVNEGMWGSPGFFYLGKNLPWFPCDFPQDPNFQMAMRDGRFNRAVIWDDRALAELEAAGFKVLEVDGPGKLLGR